MAGTYLYVGGRPMIDVGVPVVSFMDDPTVDGHPHRNFSRNRGIYGVTLGKLRRKVRMLVVHHDATLSSRACIAVLNRRGLSTHLLIDNDGTLYQMIDLVHGTWHAGKQNPASIGLDMSNAADVRYASRYRDRGVFQGEINGGTIAALGYAEPQYRTLISLIRALSRFFPRVRPLPPVDPKGQVITRMISNADEFEGIVGHFHLSAHKWDPGPGFDWKRVFNAVHGGGFQFPLSLTVGGGSGDLTGARFDRTAERFYAINEGSDQGGWYPIGLSGAWHSGVHLHAEPGTRVNNVLKGQIVAARFDSYTDLGSANFVLVRHDAKIGGEDKQFFTLAMHLGEVNLGAATTKIPWLDRARAKTGGQPAGGGKGDGGDALDGLDDWDPSGDVDPKELRPKMGQGFDALLARKVAVFDPPEDVQPGELLGFVGEFGPLEEATGQIDFSVLAASQIVDLDTFRDDFSQLSPDEDEDTLCDLDEILMRVDPKWTPGAQGLISSDAVTRFFGGNADRVEFRGFIANHISEWFVDADWSEALVRRNVWAWDTRNKLTSLLRRIAPFQWYTEDVGEATGLPMTGRVYTYHPIRFLKWMTRSQAGTKLSVRRATAEGLNDEELKAARAAGSDEREEGAWLQFDPEGEKDPEFDAFLEDEGELGDDWKKEQAPGEWPPADEFDLFEEED